MLNDHVSIARRFQRSIRLDSDVAQLDALQGFICQRSSADALLGMAAQIAQTKQRAFTWTGPYGGGKSSLAVSFCALLGPKGPVRNAAVASLGIETADQLLKTLRPSREGWLVVPVVGRRGDPIADLATSFEQARRAGGLRGRPRREITTGRELLERLKQETAARSRDGVLIVIDEFGKYLESAAADGGDIYFFQELAETASRLQGKLVIVAILHQSFERYASRLGYETRDEWAKIQGRFADVPLISGVDEIVDLVGRAIVSDLKHASSRAAVEAVAQSIRTRRPSSPEGLASRLDACWPLHPVTAVLLGPMSRRRFGQNERSVFGFLTSAEPGGFQEFLRESATTDEIFGPDRFWDYLRINLEPAILASNDSHRWAQGADAVERCEARGTPLHTSLAKSIALIDLLRNGSGLAADRETLVTCAFRMPRNTVDAALADLERWSVAVFRRHLDAWAVYAGSDFDIEGAVSAAEAQAAGLDLSRLARIAGLQPVLAKRHYHETGSLRWFHTELAHLDEVGREVGRTGDAAGRFLLSVPSGEEARKAALALCRSASANVAGDQLVAVGLPRNANRIRELGRELLALEMVRSMRTELDGDSVARREITARIAAVSADLEEELRNGFANAEWFVGGDRVILPSGSSLSRLASDLADKHYHSSPRIHSELVNRQRPSSNTQAGVRDLLYAMISAPNKPFLDIKGFPVERGLYSTVLGEAGLHRDLGDEGFGFAAPPDTGAGRTFRAAWEAAERLHASQEEVVPLGHLYRCWEERPYGIRRGVMPILALAFVLANRHRFAVYGEGKFQAEIDHYLADLLLQDENLVGLRRIDVDAFRSTILSAAAKAVEAATGQPCSSEPLEVARRLVRITCELPPWTRKTLGLSATTAEVRRVLLHADDPHKALFVDLPAIFGESDAEATASGIEAALRELAAAYPAMLRDLLRKMLGALGQGEEEDLGEIRRRARTVADLTGDLRVDAFASRLATFTGDFGDLEQIASFAINRPLRDWTDRDPDRAALALADLSLKFRRAEMLARVKGRTPAREAMAMIIGTGEVGQEVLEEFEVAERDRPRIAVLAKALTEVLNQSGAERSIALAALAETSLQALTSHDSDIRKEG